MNFDSSELKSDNVLHQLSSFGHSSVFYGDDTWLKLFPSTFKRSEGTTSFFVSDYTEVCLFSYDVNRQHNDMYLYSLYNHFDIYIYFHVSI